MKEEPRKLLYTIESLDLVEMADNETCCGFGGNLSVKFNAISAAMTMQMITNTGSTKAQ